MYCAIFRARIFANLNINLDNTYGGMTACQGTVHVLPCTEARQQASGSVLAAVCVFRSLVFVLDGGDKVVPLAFTT